MLLVLVLVLLVGLVLLELMLLLLLLLSLLALAAVSSLPRRHPVGGPSDVSNLSDQASRQRQKRLRHGQMLRRGFSHIKYLGPVDVSTRRRGTAQCMSPLSRLPTVLGFRRLSLRGQGQKALCATASQWPGLCALTKVDPIRSQLLARAGRRRTGHDGHRPCPRLP